LSKPEHDFYEQLRFLLPAHTETCIACLNAREGWGDRCQVAEDLDRLIMDLPLNGCGTL
jgi:hypothetical protein